MPTENLKQSNASNDKSRKNTLLHMHRFYTEEARNQRSMMWEAVKWFTLILIAIVGGWIKYYLDFIDKILCDVGAEGMVLLSLSVLGIALSITCVILLKSFYITNLEYITMFAKVEEELNFDRRIKKDNYYPGDNFITWHKYLEERTNYKLEGIETCGYKSRDLVEKLTKGWITKHIGMYNIMKYVFYIFSGAFIFFFVITLFALYAHYC